MFPHWDFSTKAIATCAVAGFATVATAKTAPPQLSMSDFKSLVQRSLGAESSAFGSGQVQPGQIHGKSGYFYVFKNAAVGMVGKGAPKLATERTDPNAGITAADFIKGDTCKLNGNDDVTASMPDHVSLTATSATCTKDGKNVYEGFVKFVDGRSSADYLIWVYGGNITAAQAHAVRDHILEQLKKDYAS